MKGNLFLKITSVIIAICLWVFVVSKGQSEVVMEVPLVLKNIPQGFELKDSGSMNVTITLKGDERTMNKLSPRDVKVQVDVSGAVLGTNLFAITERDIKLPQMVRLIGVNPPSISVLFERVVSRTVPVRPIITGQPAHGYVVKAVEVTPAYVNIDGEGEDVRAVSELRTHPLELLNASRTVVVKKTIDLGGHKLKTSEQYVTVKVIIERSGQ